ncbi:MAG: hypothetical protein ER33_04705 [Cyanobium sp. CACIAM 14]|nr:MAG: hypothetical protein ER33_04705 [Cyanobium sp. CACIAM 14]
MSQPANRDANLSGKRQLTIHAELRAVQRHENLLFIHPLEELHWVMSDTPWKDLRCSSTFRDALQAKNPSREDESPGKARRFNALRSLAKGIGRFANETATSRRRANQACSPISIAFPCL